MSTRPIFRPAAVEAYRRGMERAVVPRLVAWPARVVLWFALVALVTCVLVAWSVRIPTYVAASGVIATAGTSPLATTAVLFVPADEKDELRPGRPVHLLVGSRSVEGTVAQVRPRLLGPDAVRRRYGRSGLVEEPSASVVVRLSHALPASSYGGSRASARVQVASQRILSLLTS
jgi:hypothetical protein